MNNVISELKLEDYDKYLATLFAKKELQSQVAAIYLFHQKIYEIPQNVSEPMVGKIKIQWWRDVFQEIDDGKPARPHPILQEIKDSPKISPLLRAILDSYEKLLDGHQPKSFEELSAFLKESICKSIEAVCVITETEYNESLALSYSYQFIAQKIALNSGFSKNLGLMPEKLISQAKEILPKEKSTLKIITAFYIKLFEKNNYQPSHKQLRSSNWKLATKLLFQNPKT